MPKAGPTADEFELDARHSRPSAIATGAVLLALMDLCLEGTNRHGRAPDCVTTRQLAGKVIELYWPQTSEFRGAWVVPA